MPKDGTLAKHFGANIPENHQRLLQAFSRKPQNFWREFFRLLLFWPTFVKSNRKMTLEQRFDVSSSTRTSIITRPKMRPSKPQTYKSLPFCRRKQIWRFKSERSHRAQKTFSKISRAKIHKKWYFSNFEVFLKNPGLMSKWPLTKKEQKTLACITASLLSDPSLVTKSYFSK